MRPTWETRTDVAPPKLLIGPAGPWSEGTEATAVAAVAITAAILGSTPTMVGDHSISQQAHA